MTAPEESEASDQVPESPDLGASVQLEAGDTLDGPPGTDGLDAGVVAPERPFFLEIPYAIRSRSACMGPGGSPQQQHGRM